MKMKLRTAATVLLFALLYTIMSGQVTEVEKKLRTQSVDTTLGWKNGGVLSLNISQTSLTNWVAGGQNSLSVNGLFSGFINYKSDKSAWDNTLDAGYGLLKQGGISRKTDDKFEFSSKYGLIAFKNVYYAALLSFKTQMTPGYDYSTVKTKISDLFSPAYLILAVGMDYNPDAYFSAFIAPLTSRVIFVHDKALSDAGSFGVDPGKKSKSEFGGYLRVLYSRNDFKSEFLKNVSFSTKIDLFSNYADKPQNIVVNWETLLAFKVNKYLSANFNTQLIYDDKIKVPFDKNGDGTIAPGEAVGSKVQFKEILGVGLSYNF